MYQQCGAWFYTVHSDIVLCCPTKLLGVQYSTKGGEIFQCTGLLAFKTLFSTAAVKLSVVWIYFLC